MCDRLISADAEYTAHLRAYIVYTCIQSIEQSNVSLCAKASVKETVCGFRHH